jgi:hypothetical protein
MKRYWYLKFIMVYKKLVVGHIYKRVANLLLINHTLVHLLVLT